MNTFEMYRDNFRKETEKAKEASKLKPRSISVLSNHRQIFVGKIGAEACLNVLRPVLIVPLESNLIVRNKATEKCYFASSILITVGSELFIDSRDARVLFIVLDDRGTDYHSLIARKKKVLYGFGRGEVLCDFESTQALKKWALMNLHSDKPLYTNEVATWFNNWFDESGIFVESTDQRVVETIYNIKENSQLNQPVEEMASKVFLSPTRLTELFKITTGSSIRSFRLWKRICDTVRYVAEGYKPETAALDAGFADYAQFSRKFKEMFGASPCQLNTILNDNQLFWVDPSSLSEHSNYKACEQVRNIG